MRKYCQYILIAMFSSLWAWSASAAGTSYPLSGTYSCLANINFGGLKARQTNTGDGKTIIGALSLL